MMKFLNEFWVRTAEGSGTGLRPDLEWNFHRERQFFYQLDLFKEHELSCERASGRFSGRLC